MFEKLHIKAYCERDGFQGLKKFKVRSFGLNSRQSCADKIGIIITDLNMPKLSGVEMIKQVRTIEKQRNLPPTPIIIITGI